MAELHNSEGRKLCIAKHDNTMIESAYEEEKKWDNGVRCPFQSHYQSCDGTGLMANAHFHDYIEMLYCRAGFIKVFLDGISYDFSEGDMILINSKEIHSIVALSEGNNEYLVVKFEPEILYTTTQTIFEAKYLMPFTSNKSNHQKVFHRNELAETFIPEAVFDIYKEYEQKSYGYELAIRTHICRIFLWILRSWNEQDTNLSVEFALNEDTIEWLKKVFDYVETHYQQPISVAEVASLCNMSYCYFSRKFKNIMNKSFSEYLNYIRISSAEKLLMTTDLNITEIALEVGFSTSSYFIEQFKIHKNVSPKKFRSNLMSIVN